MHTLFRVFLLLLTCHTLTAQAPTNAPTQLSASYQKYVNRIELQWQTTDAQAQYNIYRKVKGHNRFDLLGTVRQNRYVDRNQLKASTDYVYHVRTVGEGGTESVPSNEAVGAILAVADQRDSVDSTAVSACLGLNVQEAKATQTHFVLRYLLDNQCTAQSATATLTLFHSSDAVLDTTDLRLAQEKIKVNRKRGAITVARNGAPKTGFLLLELDYLGKKRVFSANLKK